MTDDRHYIGKHVNVTDKRLEELSKVFVPWLMDTYLEQDTFCECDIVKKILEVTQDPAEIATMAYITGRRMSEVEAMTALQNVLKNMPMPKSSGVKN